MLTDTSLLASDNQASFTDAVSQNTYGLDSGFNANRVLSSVALSASSSSPPDPGTDFDGNGTVDLLWRNRVSGQLAIWDMQNVISQGSRAPGGMPLTWQLIGPADLDDDGDADLLWHNTNSGNVAAWILNNGVVQASSPIRNMPLDWEPLGVGDLNNDGRSDAIWRYKPTGAVHLWQVDATSMTGSQVVANLNSAWDLATTGDVNGDNLIDLIWHNDTARRSVIWLRSNTAGFNWIGSDLASELPPGWAPTGSGDFNGDRKTDLLWHNRLNGRTAAWFMTGTNNTVEVLQTKVFTTMNPVWQPLSLDRNDTEGAEPNPFDTAGTGSSTSSFSTIINFDFEVLNVSSMNDLQPGLYADVLKNFTIEYDASITDDVNGELVDIFEGFMIEPSSTILTVSNQPLPVSQALENTSDGPFISSSEFNQPQSLLPIAYEISFVNAPVFRTDGINKVGAPVATISGTMQMGFSNVDANENGTIETGETLTYARIHYPMQPALALTVPGTTDSGATVETFVSILSFPQEVYVRLSP